MYAYIKIDRWRKREGREKKREVVISSEVATVVVGRSGVYGAVSSWYSTKL